MADSYSFLFTKVKHVLLGHNQTKTKLPSGVAGLRSHPEGILRHFWGLRLTKSEILRPWKAFWGPRRLPLDPRRCEKALKCQFRFSWKTRTDFLRPPGSLRTFPDATGAELWLCLEEAGGKQGHRPSDPSTPVEATLLPLKKVEMDPVTPSAYAIEAFPSMALNCWPLFNCKDLSSFHSCHSDGHFASDTNKRRMHASNEQIEDRCIRGT